MIYCYACNEESKGYVYFIRDGLGNIKIGVTDNVEKRLKSLQTANANRLEYHSGFRVKNIKDAMFIEKTLHELFKRDRIRGEWFREENILDYLSNPKIEICGYTFMADMDDIILPEIVNVNDVRRFVAGDKVYVEAWGFMNFDFECTVIATDDNGITLGGMGTYNYVDYNKIVDAGNLKDQSWRVWTGEPQPYQRHHSTSRNIFNCERR